MRTFTYPAIFDQGDEVPHVVTFPDVPEAITQGNDDGDARAMAADALGMALLLGYLGERRPLPMPSLPKPGQVMISVNAEDAAKIAVIEAFHDAGIAQTELARRMGKDAREVRRILDPGYPSKTPMLVAALAALGRRLVIGVEAA